MLKFAILQKAKSENGQQSYRAVFESEDGEVERELASRIRRILGPKESFTPGEVDAAVKAAFDEYKKEFKEQTVKLP